MGYDIKILANKREENIDNDDVDDADNNSDNEFSNFDDGTEYTFYMTYNFSDFCKEYEFYPRDFNNKKLRVVVLALNNAIMKMKAERIVPVNYAYEKHKTQWDTDKRTFLAKLIEIRNKIDDSLSYEYYWYSD